MKGLNILQKTAKLRFAAGLIIVGLLMAGISGFVIYKDQGVQYIETNATITAVFPREEYEDDTLVTRYYCHIDYVVDGVTYSEDEIVGPEGAKVGDLYAIKYDAADPARWQTAGGDYIIYIVLAVGTIALVAGIILLVKAIKEKTKDMNVYDQVKADDSEKEARVAERNAMSFAENQDYLFHFDNKIKQGYIMKDAAGQPVYEAKMLKMTVLKPFQYEFINYVNGSRKTYEVGHTVSSTMSGPIPMLGQIPISCSFKLNGTDIWQYIGSKGYSFDMALQGIKPIYTVKYYGTPVASMETVGTNEVTGKNYKLGNLPVNGHFKINCSPDELDMIFLIAFSITRAIFFEAD